jgi:hypothetical protein
MTEILTGYALIGFVRLLHNTAQLSNSINTTVGSKPQMYQDLIEI